LRRRNHSVRAQIGRSTPSGQDRRAVPLQLGPRCGRFPDRREAQRSVGRSSASGWSVRSDEPIVSNQIRLLPMSTLILTPPAPRPPPHDALPTSTTTDHRVCQIHFEHCAALSAASVTRSANRVPASSVNNNTQTSTPLINSLSPPVNRYQRASGRTRTEIVSVCTTSRRAGWSSLNALGRCRRRRAHRCAVFGP